MRRNPPQAGRESLDPRDAAAAWFTLLESGNATDKDRLAFERWRLADHEHDRQYRHVQQIWAASAQLPEAAWRRMLERPAPSTALPLAPGRRRFGLGLAGAGLAAVAGGLVVLGTGNGSLLQTQILNVPRGGRRQISLPDGSVLDANTGTQAVVRLYAHERLVELQEGEIFFSVQSDAGRPFVVEAADTRVEVTGTRFNVRRDEGAVRVSVSSGSVRVSGGPWWSRRSLALAAGQATTVVAGQAPERVAAADLESVLAWQRGRLVLENVPLEGALAEISRYLGQPILFEAPALRQHRVSGIFNVADPQAVIRLLPDFVPVDVQQLPGGQFRVVAR